MMKQQIRECFLSGLDSTQTVIHQVRVYDPLTSSVDDVFVSDMCYQTVCCNSDEELARMWMAWKQATSAGYTDTGFIASLNNEVSSKNMGLAIVTFLCGKGSYLLCHTKPFGRMSGKLCLWCTSRMPLPLKIAITAEKQLPSILVNSDWPWINDRWLIATPPCQFRQTSYAAPPYHLALYRQCIAQYGDPPDLFSFISAGEDNMAGYELIRRMLL